MIERKGASVLEGGEMREDKEEVKMIKVLYACAHTYTRTKFPMDKNIKFSLN